MRAALYLRVSTLNGQNTDNQRLELERMAERHDWQIVEVYEDAGISGARGRENRPAFDQMLKGAVRRDFDVILAWSVDRLGRSLQDLVGFLSEIHAKGVELYLHQQGIDTTTPSGKAMFQMMGVFAEFERAMIRERVLAGLKRARARGKKLGRPMISPAKERAIRADLAGGLGFRRIMARHGVGTSVIQRIKGELKVEAKEAASKEEQTN
jgi:DNA invertase Pin-like site-specific DNA recombinase